MGLKETYFKLLLLTNCYYWLEQQQWAVKRVENVQQLEFSLTPNFHQALYVQLLIDYIRKRAQFVSDGKFWGPSWMFPLTGVLFCCFFYNRRES